MRVLNTKDNKKKYSRFSLPGFRSGSIIKKVIACLYYLAVLFFTVSMIVAAVEYDFKNSADAILLVVMYVVLILIMLTPVIAIGLSDYYDWHGIKLFLIIMVSWCILFTLSNYVSSLFSEEFIKSSKPMNPNLGVVSDGNGNQTSDGTKIDDDVIRDNIPESDFQKSDASK